MKQNEFDSPKFDNIYKNKPLDKIPWNKETPPEPLVKLINTGLVKPCRCIDLGCGTGTSTTYLAAQGFEATGVDISPTAISLAQEKAKEKGVKCRFLAADILNGLSEEPFDFAFEWTVLHSIFPEKREKYVASVSKIVNTGGKYLSVCFSEKDPYFAGSGKYRKTSLGTILYFSSEKELGELFGQHFKIIDLKTIEIGGHVAPHLANLVFMEKEP